MNCMIDDSVNDFSYNNFIQNITVSLLYLINSVQNEEKKLFWRERIMLLHKIRWQIKKNNLLYLKNIYITKIIKCLYLL